MWDRPSIELYRRNAMLLCVAAAVFGMAISPPVLSIGLIGLVAIGFLDPLTGINPQWKATIQPWLRKPLPLALISLYLLLLFGFWQTEDWPYYLERLRIKLPLLALPLAWPGLPRLSARDSGQLMAALALFLATLLSGVLINYAANAPEINRLIAMGQAVPAPRNHIRFSLLIASSIFFALRAYELRTLGLKVLWTLLALYLFIGLHFLAVRSGLVGAYAGLGVYILMSAWRRGNWWPALASLIGLIVIPILAYGIVPSMRAKVDYARYELLHRDPSIDENEYSDEGRLASIIIGLEIWQDYPLLGVGPGNMLKETNRRYAIHYLNQEGKRPHNQLVSAMAGSGVLGGIVTLGAFLTMAWVGLRRRNAAFLAVWGIIFVSCLVENTLENSVGASILPLFLLLFLTTDFRKPPRALTAWNKSASA